MSFGPSELPHAIQPRTMPALMISKKVSSDCQNRIKTTLREWENDNFDFMSTKIQLMEFIKDNCLTQCCRSVPLNPKDYNMQYKSSKALAVTHAKSDKLMYLFDATSGRVCVGVPDGGMPSYPKNAEWELLAFALFDRSPSPRAL